MINAVMFALITVYAVVWVADPAGVTSAVLRWFYRSFRPWIWRGSEQSYVAVMRWSAVLAIPIGVVGFIASAR